MMLALDGEIFLMVEGELIYSPINDVLPVPIQQVDVIDGVAFGYLEQGDCFAGQNQGE